MSRETRRLLTAGVLAVAALWLLARVRFQERPVTPNPIPAVLSQLGGRPNYDDLAAEIERLQFRVEPSLLVFDVPSGVPGSGQVPRGTIALRLDDDLAVILRPAGSRPEMWNDARVLAHDPASGLVVVRVPARVRGPLVTAWALRRPQQPRYLVASDVSARGVSLRPVFVGSLDPVDSPLWPAPLLAAPGQSNLTPGSFVFTHDAELVGLVVAHGGESAIVPGETVRQEADRLLRAPAGPVGTIGLEVQPLTESVASVTGAPVGVVVAWVEPEGPAMGQLMVGDVIEAIDGRALETRQHWDARMARLVAGETLTLRVRSGGDVREVELAAAAAARPASPTLGLTLRRQVGIGAEVVRVDRASAADRAGLAVGDVITLFAGVAAPTPDQVMGAFTSVREGQRVLIAVTRGEVHHVMTLER